VRHRVRVDEIPDGGFRYEVDEQTPALRDALRGALDDDTEHHVRAELEVTRRERTVRLDGRLVLSARLACARCLEPVEHAAERAVHVVLLLERPADDEEEQELAPEELDESYLEGDEIDLPELLREQVLLALPVKPLCQEACKGLCPGCGADLNREACTCEGTPVDPRMAVLQGLKIEDDN